MNYKMMGRFAAQILGIECVFMIPALAISIFFRERAAIRGFAVSILIIALLGAVLYIICRKGKKRFYAKDGMVCVGIRGKDDGSIAFLYFRGDSVVYRQPF